MDDQGTLTIIGSQRGQNSRRKSTMQTEPQQGILKMQEDSADLGTQDEILIPIEQYNALSKASKHTESHNLSLNNRRYWLDTTASGDMNTTSSKANSIRI